MSELSSCRNCFHSTTGECYIHEAERLSNQHSNKGTHDLSEWQFEIIQNAHEKESLWYFFLNYGNPLRQHSEYSKLYEDVHKALVAYAAFMEAQAEKQNTEFIL